MKKVVLITGASSGLGKELARQLCQRNYRVYGTSRRPKEQPEGYHLLAMDVREAESVEQAVAELIRREGRIDILINNAGIGIAGPLEQLSMENIEKVLDTNVKGVVRSCQAVLPHLRHAGGGKIINISSIGALFGLPYRGVYCASKAAVGLVTEALRMEVRAFGIQACTILAGDIQTNINANRIRDYREDSHAYKTSFERVYAGIDEDVDKGMPAEEVARQVVRIAERQRLKPHYIIGRPLQRLSARLKRLLPGALFEKIIMRYSGM